jgi:hypothetical protein
VPVITVTYLKNKLKSKKGLRHGSNGRVFVEYTQGPEFKLRIQKTMRRRRRKRKKERRKKREEEEKIQKKEKEGEEKREQWIDTKEESGCTRTQGNGQGKSQNLAAQGHKEMGKGRARIWLHKDTRKWAGKSQGPEVSVRGEEKQCICSLAGMIQGEGRTGDAGQRRLAGATSPEGLGPISEWGGVWVVSHVS